MYKELVEAARRTEMIPNKEREALMRLCMCANRMCGACKYDKDWYEERCKEEINNAMNVLTEALERGNNSGR